jgi:hypothetical protein
MCETGGSPKMHFKSESFYIISKCWLVGDNLLLRDFGPYGIIFMTMCVHYFRFSRHS